MTLEEYVWAREETDARQITLSVKLKKTVFLYGPRGYLKRHILRMAVKLNPGDVAWVDVPRLGMMAREERLALLAEELRARPEDVRGGLKPAIRHAGVKLVVFDGLGIEAADAPFAREVYDYVGGTNSTDKVATFVLLPTVEERVDPAAFEPRYFPQRFTVIRLGPLPVEGAPDFAAAVGCSLADAEFAIRLTGGNPRWAWIVAAARRDWTGDDAAFRGHVFRDPGSPLAAWWRPVDQALEADRTLTRALKDLLVSGSVTHGPVLEAARLISAGLADPDGAIVPAAKLRYGAWH